MNKLKKEFFEKNPLCAFCGGETKATTQEHCPPKALFQDKEWPEGFVFPACDECNKGTSDSDVLAAFIARLDPISDAGDNDGRLMGTFLNASTQHPGFAQQMMNVSSRESRRAAKKLGIQRPPGKCYTDIGIVKITDHMDSAVRTLAGKLTKAVYYQQTGRIFPNLGEIQVAWFTNSDLFRFGNSPLLNALRGIESKQLRIERNGHSLNDQFDCKYSESENQDLILIQAVFGKAFGFASVASIAPGVLRAIDQEVTEENDHKPKPFKFL